MPRKPKTKAEGTVDAVDLLKSISGQLGKVTSRLDRMEEKMASLEKATPRIVPQIERQEQVRANIPNLIGVPMAIGETIDGTIRQATVDTGGARVRGYRRLADGTRVILNTAKVALQPAKSSHFDPATVGEIVSFHFYSETRGEGKYRVRFPGLTDARGDGFYESDLIVV